MEATVLMTVLSPATLAGVGMVLCAVGAALVLAARRRREGTDAQDTDEH